MLEVELAELRTLFEAVHYANLIVVQVDLNKVRKASECIGHFGQKIILQVDVKEIGALPCQDAFVRILRVWQRNSRQAFVSHLQMCLFSEVWSMVPLSLLSHFTEEQIDGNGLRLARYIRWWDLIKHVHRLHHFFLLLSLLSSGYLLIHLVLLLLRDVRTILAHIVTVDLYRCHDLVKKAGGLLSTAELLDLLNSEQSE